jgi:hypothetical protein
LDHDEVSSVRNYEVVKERKDIVSSDLISQVTGTLR